MSDVIDNFDQQIENSGESFVDETVAREKEYVKILGDSSDFENKISQDYKESKEAGKEELEVIKDVCVVVEVPFVSGDFNIAKLTAESIAKRLMINKVLGTNNDVNVSIVMSKYNAINCKQDGEFKHIDGKLIIPFKGDVEVKGYVKKLKEVSAEPSEIIDVPVEQSENNDAMKNDKEFQKLLENMKNFINAFLDRYAIDITNGGKSLGSDEVVSQIVNGLNDEFNLGINEEQDYLMYVKFVKDTIADVK